MPVHLNLCCQYICKRLRPIRVRRLKFPLFLLLVFRDCKIICPEYYNTIVIRLIWALRKGGGGEVATDKGAGGGGGTVDGGGGGGGGGLLAYATYARQLLCQVSACLSSR